MNLDPILFSEEELAAALEESNRYLADPRQGLALLVRLASGGAAPDPALAALDALIEVRLPALAARSRTALAPDVLQGLRACRAAIGETLSFPDLANKTVVGIGGAFSAGKSRFLNSLSGTSLLPEDLGPCTVIPTYLGHGARSVVALNAFGRAVPMDSEALAAVSHAFARQQLGQASLDCLSRLIRLLMVSCEGMPWQHLVFLDTPGHNPPGREGERSDAEVARRQLALADHVVWLVSAGNGTLRADDIDFLRAIGHRKPVFFVLTQADLVASSALPALLERVRADVERAGIACAGVMAWDAGTQTAGRHCGGDAIHAWLDQLGGRIRYPGLRRRCALLAERVLLQCRRAHAHDKALLASLNEWRVLAGAAPPGRHAELDDEMRRLRQALAEHDAAAAGIAAWRDELLQAVAALLGPCIADDTPEQSDELLVEHAGAGTPPAGRAWPLRISGARADLKCMLARFLDLDIELRIPFSRIRQAWGIEPLALGTHSELSARLVDADGPRWRFALAHHHLPQENP